MKATWRIIVRISLVLVALGLICGLVGIFTGGKVLFAAPDMGPSLVALQAACESPLVNGHPWTPHTTLLIDQPEVIGAAVPVLMQRFTPLRARIDRLHLCAFWPTREILRVPLAGK